MLKNVAIIGVGQSDFKYYRPGATVAELAQEVAVLATEDAGISLNEIDAVVSSQAPTSLFGIDAVQRWYVGAVGGRNKPFLRINTGGATGGSAAQAGYFHVASGLFDLVLVVGAEKIGESPDTQLILNQIWEPAWERDFALNAINMCAFQGVSHMHRYKTSVEDFARVSVRSHANALLNSHAHIRKAVTMDEVLSSRILCWPITLLQACPRSSGGCALVLASEKKAKELSTRPAWITGVQACTNTVFMGDKMDMPFNDHADFDDLTIAAEKAYAMAGIDDPLHQLDVAEIYAPFSNMEIAAAEALGFCPKGQGAVMGKEGAFDMDGELPINPSGGVLCTNPISVTALVRVAEAALQVMERAGQRQVKGAKRAVATGMGGSLQIHTTTVLADEPK